jgi:hypothetical protein
MTVAVALGADETAPAASPSAANNPNVRNAIRISASEEALSANMVNKKLPGSESPRFGNEVAS